MKATDASLLPCNTSSSERRQRSVGRRPHSAHVRPSLIGCHLAAGGDVDRAADAVSLYRARRRRTLSGAGRGTVSAHRSVVSIGGGSAIDSAFREGPYAGMLLAYDTGSSRS